MNLRFNLFFPYCLILAAGSVYAHELEDGFVERALEVVVRDRKLQVRYFIGLNENTMNSLLQQWKPDGSSDPTVNDVSERFRQVLLDQLVESIEFKIADQPNCLTPCGLDICPKHHFDFVARLEFELPADQTVDLTLTDQKLGQWNSAARYSFKGLGSTMVSRTNVAPIIIRSTRIDFTGLNDADRIAKSKIIATVTTPPAPPKIDSTER